MDGVLLIDKPTGPSSFDVIRSVRRVMGERKAGHAGTLDPLASGLLVVCLGKGTRLVPYMMEGRKSYEATVKLGAATDTDDAEGETILELPVPVVNEKTLDDACAELTGTISQRPPIYSAIKRGGEALYKKARRGEHVEVEPRNVVVHSIQAAMAGPDAIRLSVSCGKGTYIRSIARDLAVGLGTAGHLIALRRTVTSGFQVEESLPLDELDSESGPRSLLSLSRALQDYPHVVISPEQLALVNDGRPLDTERLELPEGETQGVIRVLDDAGRLTALARVVENQLKMERVFK